MQFPSLSIILPAYNEAARLERSLQEIRSWASQNCPDLELIVVDDGSKDETGEIAKQNHAIVIRHIRNRGKGASVCAGLDAATRRRRLVSDVDLSTPLSEIPRFWEALEGGADIAIGSRSMPGAVVEVHQPWYRESMGRTFNRFVQAFVLPGYIDTQCGFKMFTAEAARKICRRQVMTGFAFDVEILLIAHRLKLSVQEIPVHWRNDPDSRVGVIRDSSAMLLELIRIKIRDQQNKYQ